MADTQALSIFQSLLPEEKKAIRALVAKGVNKYEALHRVSGEGPRSAGEPEPDMVITAGPSRAQRRQDALQSAARGKQELADMGDDRYASKKQGSFTGGDQAPDALDAFTQGVGNVLPNAAPTLHALYKSARGQGDYDEVKKADMETVAQMSEQHPNMFGLGGFAANLATGGVQSLAAKALPAATRAAAASSSFLPNVFARIAQIGAPAVKQAAPLATTAAGRLAQVAGNAAGGAWQGVKAAVPLGALAGATHAETAAQAPGEAALGALAAIPFGAASGAVPGVATAIAPRLATEAGAMPLSALIPGRGGWSQLAGAAKGDVAGNAAGFLRLVGENPRIAGGVAGGAVGAAIPVPGLGALGIGGGAANGQALMKAAAPEILAAAERISPAPRLHLDPIQQAPTGTLPVEPLAADLGGEAMGASGLSLRTPPRGLPSGAQTEGPGVPRLRLAPASDTEPGSAPSGIRGAHLWDEASGAPDPDQAWFLDQRAQSRAQRPTGQIGGSYNANGIGAAPPSPTGVPVAGPAGGVRPRPQPTLEPSPLADISAEQRAARAGMTADEGALSDRGLRFRMGAEDLPGSGAEKNRAMDAEMRGAVGRDVTPPQGTVQGASVGNPPPDHMAMTIRGMPEQMRLPILEAIRQTDPAYHKLVLAELFKPVPGALK